jgi:hypothetical protein
LEHVPSRKEIKDERRARKAEMMKVEDVNEVGCLSSQN